jgi:glyoxylase I family protein
VSEPLGERPDEHSALSFSHVGVCVSDLERSTRFYAEVLGFRPVLTMDMGPEVAKTMEVEGCAFTSRVLGRGDVRVELLHWRSHEPEGDGRRQPMTRLGLTHLCLRVDDVEPVLEAAERFGGTAHRQTASELPGMGIDGGPVRLVYLTDPDGIRIELMAGTPELPI